MERQEDSYVRGEKVLYREDNMVLATEVLENNCDSDNIAYKLRIIKTVVPHFVFGEFKEGATFDFSNMRNTGRYFFEDHIIGEVDSKLEAELNEEGGLK